MAVCSSKTMGTFLYYHTAPATRGEKRIKRKERKKTRTKNNTVNCIFQPSPFSYITVTAIHE